MAYPKTLRDTLVEGTKSTDPEIARRSRKALAAFDDNEPKKRDKPADDGSSAQVEQIVRAVQRRVPGATREQILASFSAVPGIVAQQSAEDAINLRRLDKAFATHVPGPSVSQNGNVSTFSHCKKVPN